MITLENKGLYYVSPCIGRFKAVAHNEPVACASCALYDEKYSQTDYDIANLNYCKGKSSDTTKTPTVPCDPVSYMMGTSIHKVIFEKVNNKDMEKRVIKIALDDAKAWYNSGNNILKELALSAFTREELEGIDFNNICPKYYDSCIAAKSFPISVDGDYTLRKLDIYIRLLKYASLVNKGWVKKEGNTGYFIHFQDGFWKVHSHSSVCYVGVVYFKNVVDANNAINIFGSYLKCLQEGLGL